MKKLRIVYMGTPDFAVPSLQILVENNYDIAAVITAPDKPKGRGQKLSQSPVKRICFISWTTYFTTYKPERP